MQPDSFYNDIAEKFEKNEIKYSEIKPKIIEDGKEMGLVAMCDPKECDGKHLLSTPKGRFIWAMLDTLRVKESPRKSITDVLEGLRINVKLISIPNDVDLNDLLAKFQGKEETSH